MVRLGLVGLLGVTGREIGRHADPARWCLKKTGSSVAIAPLGRAALLLLWE
jgi:hypothetical protein